MTAVAPLTKHPAKFSDPILPVLRRLVEKELTRRRKRDGVRGITVVDPFAGVGRIHRLARLPRGATGTWVDTVGVEIEPEWAACHANTVCADAFHWLRMLGKRGAVLAGEETSGLPMNLLMGNQGGMGRPLIDMWVTSPTYGNRMADHHDAQDDSTRHGYAFYLGRLPSEGSTSVMPWGPDYWEAHAEAYRLMLAASRPGAPLVLNVSNFPKANAMVDAVEWHRGAAIGAGWLVDRSTRVVKIETSRLRHGQNWQDRATHEVVMSFRKGTW
jgi:hypothetical protein